MEWIVWALLVVAFLEWLAGWALSARLRPVPDVSDGSVNEKARISVIIPARNEEANLARLLPALSQQDFAPHEILVVDDRSNDGTAGVVRENGAVLVEGKPLPEEWYGKPWACAQGGAAASGDWLLFLDADTIPVCGGLRRIAGLSRDSERVHSVCPFHRVEKPYEQLSAFFNVIMLLGMNAFSVKGSKARSIGLFGQALFISRRHYDVVGGHEPVRDQVLENFHLARHLARLGISRRCYLGRGTLEMRMFPGGYRDMVAGWSKGIVSGAGNTPKSALAGISIWLGGLITSVILLVFLPCVSAALRWAIGGLYAACAVQCHYLFRHAGSFWRMGALLYPVGLFFYQAVFFGAIRRKRSGQKIQWKGRDVD